MIHTASVLIATLFFSFSCFAGWSSGGGGLLKNSNNPWFLNNTSAIKYCVQIDTKNFGASEVFVTERIERAFAFWRKQFEFAKLPILKSFGQILIANQKLTKVSCTSDVDITFQFGVLEHAQEEYLKDPKQYGAVSVRTGYSEKDLRGKGFVYLSPASGPLALDLDGIKPDLWTNEDGAKLYLALLHELGHVFGLPHIGSYGLMSEGFVEKVLENGSAAKWIDDTRFFFKLPDATNAFCLEGPSRKMWKAWADVLALSHEQKCIQIKFQYSRTQLLGPTTADFYAGSNPAKLVLIGSADLKNMSSMPNHLVQIWLSKEQTVFPSTDIPDFAFNKLLGPSTWSVRKRGYFKSSDGNYVHSLIFTFSQGESLVTIDAIGTSGEIISLIPIGGFR